MYVQYREEKKTTLISLHAHAARGDCALLFIYKLENLQALKITLWDS